MRAAVGWNGGCNHLERVTIHNVIHLGAHCVEGKDAFDNLLKKMSLTN